MADGTGIEWTDATWTPIRARHRVTGKLGWFCTHASPGCANCYAEGINKRLGTGLPFKPGHEKDVEIVLDEAMLLAPLRWKNPRMIFVCSMTDLFADFVKDEWIDKIFAVMALCPQHIFQVLTKRSARMRKYFEPHDRGLKWADAVAALGRPRPHSWVAVDWDNNNLPNVWFGVSAEDQPRADERIPDLRATPAAVRWVSYEPALGPVDFTSIRHPRPSGENETYPVDVLTPPKVNYASGVDPDDPAIKRAVAGLVASAPPRLDWVVCGGESGPGARPMHPDWARSARDQCAAAGVPFFLKQWGEFVPQSGLVPGTHAIFQNGDCYRAAHVMIPGQIKSRPEGDGYLFLARVGKRAAGRLLDGVEHNAMPAARR